VLISSWSKELQTLDNLVFGWRCAGWYLQLSNVKPTQDGSALADCQVIYKTMAASQRESDLNSAFKKADRLQKAYRQTVSLNYANNIISQLMFAFAGRNRFISMKSLWRPSPCSVEFLLENN
jgi:hypothetical protein